MGPVIRYCEGRPERGARALAAEERARVAACRRRLWASAFLRLLLVPAAPLAAAGAFLAARAAVPGSAEVRVAALAAFAALVLAVPVALLWALDGLRAATALAQDLAGGTVLEFGDGEASLSLLPRSERVLALGGLPADLGERAPVGVAAPPAREVPTYALPPDALSATALGDGVVRRALTAAERAELEAHVARLLRPPWLCALSAGVGAALGLRLAVSPDAPAAVRALAIVSLAGIGFASVRRQLRTRRLARRLQDDEAEGWVVRLTAGALAGDELLLRSGAPWTVEGGPADWRVARPSPR